MFGEQYRPSSQTSLRNYVSSSLRLVMSKYSTSQPVLKRSPTSEIKLQGLIRWGPPIDVSHKHVPIISLFQHFQKCHLSFITAALHSTNSWIKTFSEPWILWSCRTSSNAVLLPLRERERTLSYDTSRIMLHVFLEPHESEVSRWDRTAFWETSSESPTRQRLNTKKWPLKYTWWTITTTTRRNTLFTYTLMGAIKSLEIISHVPGTFWADYKVPLPDFG